MPVVRQREPEYRCDVESANAIDVDSLIVSVIDGARSSMPVVNLTCTRCYDVLQFAWGLIKRRASQTRNTAARNELDREK